MTIAFIMLLIAGLLPYVVVGIAKAGAPYDNARPRDSMAQASGLPARAYAAHQNSFEAFPLFAAAVLTAAFREADDDWSALLSVVFILARIAYIAAYLADRATLRSIVWSVGFFATLGLFAISF